MGAGHGHSHGLRQRRETTLWVACAITAVFMLVEFVAGWWSHSLALMADAVHMLTDAGGLAFALFAVRFSGKLADNHRTFGYGRMQVLAAFINGLVVLGLGSVLFTQAVKRFWHPQQVESGIMFWVAVCGLVVNLAILGVLHRGGGKNVNIRAAMLHVMFDTLSSVAVIVAALGISAFGYNWIDPVATMLVSLMIVRGAKDILSDSGHILLEGKPKDLDLDAVANTIKADVPEVLELHHLHAWSLTGEDLLISLHARLVDGAARGDDDILRAIKVILHDRFHIEHSTVQLERGVCADKHAHDHSHKEEHHHDHHHDHQH